MEQENQPEKIQFVIVPEFILTDSNIPIGEKLLFGDIASHTKQKGYCWGSNEYFVKRYKVSSRTISRWINDFGKTAVKETGIDEVSQETLEEFQKDKDLQRNQVYTLLSALTEKNIDVLEEISKWEELMPSIQNFREWTKERCRDAQDTYRDSQLDLIVDLFVATFANSNKAIKDGYDRQIKQYDHTLNGYTKQTANGKKHFFGAAEISQMFESATPELLRKIAGVIAEHGCKDVKEWMQKSPWYREFELGREAERQLKREREWER